MGENAWDRAWPWSRLSLILVFRDTHRTLFFDKIQRRTWHWLPPIGTDLYNFVPIDQLPSCA